MAYFTKRRFLIELTRHYLLQCCIWLLWIVELQIKQLKLQCIQLSKRLNYLLNRKLASANSSLPLSLWLSPRHYQSLYHASTWAVLLPKAFFLSLQLALKGDLLCNIQKVTNLQREKKGQIMSSNIGFTNDWLNKTYIWSMDNFMITWEHKATVKKKTQITDIGFIRRQMFHAKQTLRQKFAYLNNLSQLN